MKMFEYLAGPYGPLKMLTQNYYTDSTGVIRRLIPKLRGKKARKIDKIKRHNAKFDLEHKRNE